MIIGAAVIALHAVICWLLLAKMRVLRAPEIARDLEILWIPAPHRPSPAPDEAPTRNPQAFQPTKRRLPSQPSPGAPRISQPPQDNAITPPVDWQAELAREAQAAAAPKPDPRQDFGFPHAVAPAAKAHEFAWDRDHTHRVEAGEGALIVHLNDNCEFVMTPLPFLFCRPGKRPANGDLFEHMKEPSADATGVAP